MRTMFWTSTAAFLLLAIPHAQDGTRTPPAPPAPAHNTMVLTGCLAAGSDESTFKLTNATPNPQASASQPQPVGTSGERAEYQLRAEKSLDKTGVAPVELKRFVGRQVEIVARSSEEPVASDPPKAAGDAKADPDPSKPIEKRARPLTVTAVKQVLATCR
ncbi:MAG TPA: hypothetical protein VGJ39_17360 [Vicinamibacterales bacterium]|jgi:hypothetical protein